MAKKTMKQIKKNISTLTATELRLTVAAAQDELNTRRDCWVNEMHDRFWHMNCAGKAFDTCLSNPHNYWLTDRVVVTCFKDKNRSQASVGVARLSPNDSYDRHIGIAIAFARAMGEEVPDLF